MDRSLLLKTLLLSTSQINIFRYCRDKKKKRKIIGNIIGLVILYAMLMGYSILICIGYGAYGLAKAIPLMCALLISSIAFVFTFLKTNGYLFNFREYDMLMSLPFELKTVAGSKFLYMYIKSLPWYLSIIIAMMIGYGIYVKPAFYVYIIWLILSLFLPVIPMLIAAFLGFIIARISSGFRKTNIVETVLSIILVIFAFSLRFFLERMFRDDRVEATLESAFTATEKAARIYLPAGWFADAILESDVLAIILLIALSTVLFVLIFRIVGNSYRNINSALKSHAASRNLRMTKQKSRSVLNAIAFKEFKRLTSSTVYMTNAGMGEILAALLGTVTLIFGFDGILSYITNNVPFDYALVQPAIPFIVYFCIGMVATTACSPSLEGKNYWIVESLPIENKTLYQGKMLFNMYLTVPFSIFATLCMCISARVPFVNTILYVILGIALCAFSTCWGCVCGVKHMRLDWENEVEVIKQGAAVAIYMFPNMFVTMGLIVGTVFLGIKTDHRVLTLVLLLISAALSALSYMRVMSLSEKQP